MKQWLQIFYLDDGSKNGDEKGDCWINARECPKMAHKVKNFKIAFMTVVFLERLDSNCELFELSLRRNLILCWELISAYHSRGGVPQLRSALLSFDESEWDTRLLSWVEAGNDFCDQSWLVAEENSLLERNVEFTHTSSSWKKAEKPYVQVRFLTCKARRKSAVFRSLRSRRRTRTCQPHHTAHW